MSGQWLHQPQHLPQPPPPDGFGQPGYQGHPQYHYGHQAEPYGHPQDPYGQQAQQYYPPYNYQQSGPYHQPYAQQTGQPHKQHIARPSLNTCYNCGAPDHWAQDCPEPRREVPAGDLARQSTSRPPFKKFRPNHVPPVITKYAVPTNMPNVQGPGTPFGTPHHPQSVPPSYQAPYVPPTPVSAQSARQPQFSQWSESQQHQYHHNQFQRRNTYPQQPYPAGPHHGCAYYGGTHQFSPGPHVQSPVSAHGPQQFPVLNTPYSAGGQRYGPQRGAHSTASPSGGAQANAVRSKFASNAGKSRQGSVSQPEPALRQVTPQQHDDKEEDELSLLDVPDIPACGGEGGAGVRLVKHPLPAFAEQLSANPELSSLPSPSSKGFIKSQYIATDLSSHAVECFANKVDSQTQTADPVFTFIDRNSAYFPLHVLQECRGRLSIEELGAEAVNVERKSPREGIAPITSNGYRPMTSNEAETRLAALGVTGLPKPVLDPVRPYDPQLFLGHTNGHPYAHNGSVSGNRDHSDWDRSSPTSVNGSGDWVGEQQVNGSNGSNEGREQTPALMIEEEKDIVAGKQHDPFDPEDNGPFDLENTQEHSSAKVDYRGGNARPHPPPPTHRSPSSNQPQAGSPTLYTPEKKSRKRVIDLRNDSDEERGNERRRQYDDVTPKLKRRQPKVAEAYSRRW